jgi:hypothetical protein
MNFLKLRLGTFSGSRIGYGTGVVPSPAWVRRERWPPSRARGVQQEVEEEDGKRVPVPAQVRVR